VDISEIMSALDFWQTRGVLTISDAVQTEKVEAKTVDKEKRIPKKVLQKTDEAPRYNTEELSVILEKRSDVSHLIDECQQIVGKMFNTHEINILLGLVDYFALGWDYVLELLEYCAKIGKHSIHYVEKTAIAFMNDDINTVDALKEKIAELEIIYSNENIVRRLFGMKARALTAKEKKCIGNWFGKFGYGEDIITKAYEMTVAAINEPSVAYANAILERWFSEGFKTVEEIDKAAAEKAESSSPEEGSFDTDDFFEAALQRSYKK
jgi:DnaD/phage-associated family protein